MKNILASLKKHAPLLLAMALSFTTSCATNQHASKKKSVYLFTSFQDADQKFLRFLWSDDGYHWNNVPGTFLTADVGEAKQLRDPSIVRGPDGIFHLVWTTGWHDPRGFGYASSPDLVHWSDQSFIPVMDSQPTTVNVWAPEISYDELDKQFIIVWASTIPGWFPDLTESHTNNHRLFYTTTRDFETFSPTKLFFEPGFSVIDGFLITEKDRHIMFFKDNSRPHLQLRVASAITSLGPWTNISDPITPQFTEGPCALKIGDDYIIYFDSYRAKRYGAIKTRDFKTFIDISPEVSFPESHKHGTAIKVPRKILDGLLQAHPNL